jgi:PASTA domain
MHFDPKIPVIRGEVEPLRDAADFMMDAIAGHFAPRSDLAQLARAPERRSWIVPAFLAVALGLLSVTTLITIAYIRAQFVILPDFAGANVKQAKSVLLDVGLQVTTRFESSTMVRAHHVIEQTPPAGQWLRKGGTVALTASTGLPRVAAQHHRSAVKPNARAPAVATTTPRALASAPRTASTPEVKRPIAIPANTPFGIRSVGPVHVYSSPSCTGENLAVEIQGLSTGCTAFAIASTGNLLHGAGSGLVVPVTSLRHPGEVLYGLMYVTPTGASRHFFGVLYGNSTGHLIVSVHDGFFEAQNGSHARYATVGAPAPVPTAVAADTRVGPKPNCPQRSWLQKTVKHVFESHSADCP